MSSDSARDAAVADEPEAGDEAAAVDADGASDSGDAGDIDAADEATDDDVDEPEQDEPEQADTKSNRRGPLPKRLLLGSAALALAAFIVAAVFGVLWLVTATGDRAELAASRDEVIDTARKGVQAVTEVDYQNPDKYFERSKAVSTDEFAKQLTKAEDSFRKMLSQAKVKVETDVQDVAVQQLNDHEGTATFLAVARTEVTTADKSRTKVMRLKGQAERVSTGGSQEWKLSGLSPVPVVGSGAQAPNSGQKSGSGAQQGESQQGSGQGSGPGK